MCMRISFLSEIISQQGVSTDPNKVQVLINMLSPMMEKVQQPFLCILSYLSKFSPVTEKVCELLCTQTSVKNRLDMEQNVSGSI